ncbi:MAG: Ig-like domain-containing protein [Pyrinomonadaceae bacterium]
MPHIFNHPSHLRSALNIITTRRTLLIAILAAIALTAAVFRLSSIPVRSDNTVSKRGSYEVAFGERAATSPGLLSRDAKASHVLFPGVADFEAEDKQGLRALLHHRWGGSYGLANVLLPTITATKTDSLFTDVDGDNNADPGDTLKYTVVISASGEDATGVTFTDTVDPNTAFVGGSLTATPVAVDDSYAATGNVRISVPAPGVLGNDFLGIPTATITVFPAVSANGGDVTLNADGSFTYNPPPGFEGSDSFTYTLTNSEGSNNATVTITVSGMIWFVNSAASCPCDGRLTNPFIELTGVGSFDAVAADDPGDNIFLYTGAYTGGLTLLNNQRLIGQGATASLASITGLTPPTFSDSYPATGGVRPTVVNAAGSVILLGSGNYLRGFDIGNSSTSGSGISGTGFGTLTVSDLAISGTGRALNLDTGTLGATIDSISSSNSTTNGVTLNNVGGTFTVSGSTTVTNATQEGIKISNVSNIGSPSLQFGAVNINSRNATGILLDNVDNSSGAMSFGATSIPNPNNVGGYGIRVQNSSAAVTVASATISDANIVTAQNDAGADGIPDTDGDGDAIFLTNNPGSFTLNGGTLSNCGNDCIDLRDSSGLVLSNVNISTPGLDVTGATGAGFGGHGISAINLTGTSSITGGTISGFNVANRDGLYLINTTSTALTLTIEGATFQNATGNRGIGIQGRSAANMTVTVGGPTNNVATNCTFSNISGTALQTSAGASAGSTATVNLTVQNSTFQNSSTDGKTNLLASVTEAGKSAVVIQDNTFSNVFITASTGEALINVNNSATLAGNQLGLTIQRNNINNVGSSASTCAGGAVPCRGPLNVILVLVNNGANIPNTLIIDDNTLTNVQQGGILVDMANTGVVASNVNARITNNCIGRLRVAGICVGLDARVGLSTGLANGRGIGVERRTAGAKQANVLIDGNTIRNGVGQSAGTLNTPGVFARAQNDTISSITLTNNDIDTNFVGAADVRLDTAGTATQCDDITGNTFPTGVASLIDINEAAGSTHNVEQASAAAVTAANGGLVVVTPDAGVAFGVACAAPPSAMLFRKSIRDYLARHSGAKGQAVPQPKTQAKVQPTHELISAVDGNTSRTGKTERHHASVARADRNENAITQRNAKATMARNRASATSFATLADVNLAIGTLPAGESVTITFRVTVDNPFTGAMAQVSNQGTVSGTNFSDVLTDDPTVGGAADPTVTPIDLPDVTVAVSPGSVAEDGATNLDYTFTREGSTANALTVNFSVGGSASFTEPDYTQTGAATFTNTSGTVVIPSGSSTAVVTIDPSADFDVEPDETVILTVTSGTGYAVGTPALATGTITNDDTDVSVAVSPGSVAEDGATNLVYTFTRTGVTSSALTVNFSVGGTADFGASPNDYTQTGATTFTPPTGTVTFSAGSPTATVTVDPETDSTIEPDETVILTLTSGAGYNVASPNSATGTISNDDADVSVTVSPASVAEDGATNLVYTFTRTGFTASALTVNFSVGGTAVFGTSPDDYTQTGATTYTTTSGTVTFTPGSPTATVTVDPETDTTAEPDETVILTLTAGASYNVVSPSSATGTILNDDTLVSVVVAPTSTAEGGSNLVYTFTRTGPTVSALTVNFSVGGTAAFPADYSQSGAATFTPPTATVNFGAGNSTATVTVTPLTDCEVEGPETVQFTVTPGAGYGVGSPSSATGTITNTPDSAPPTITLDPNVQMTLWPPNHQYQTVEVTDFVLSASDSCDPSVNLNSVYILKITSDEVEDGAGDGNTLNDIVIAADCKSAQLRAERSGSGDGRVYTITFKVKDAAGNFTTATAKVTVRKSPNNPAVDSGPNYTVNSSCP